MSDIAIAVREGTDAIMLSGESAYGKFPYKSVDVMATVAKHTEQSMLSYAVRTQFHALSVRKHKRHHRHGSVAAAQMRVPSRLHAVIL